MSAFPSPVNPDLQRSEPEFSFDASDFERVRKLIYQRAGISLHAGKQAMVYSRLSRRLRDVGYNSFGQYPQALERGTGRVVAGSDTPVEATEVWTFARRRGGNTVALASIRFEPI